MDFLVIDETANERVLMRGWLRGSQRRTDPARSRPWLPYHPHDRRDPLIPAQVYEFNIAIVPTGVLVKAGMRFGIRIKCADKDDKPRDFPDMHGLGHLYREKTATVTVWHNDQYPSHLLVPITKGNRLGTFISGGVMKPLPDKH